MDGLANGSLGGGLDLAETASFCLTTLIILEFSSNKN
jgi:hypothetical protein